MLEFESQRNKMRFELGIFQRIFHFCKPMKRNLVQLSIFIFLCTSLFSCKKCYECTCTDINTLDGCTVLGEDLELCDSGFIGKTALTTRVIIKETEGYTCTLK